MKIKFVSDVEWDGKALSARVVTGFGEVLCRVPRDTIHALPVYSDAIEREIRSQRHAIMERLAPALGAKLAIANRDRVIELLPSEVH
ncbi:hypothetical protein [Bradyrhizobium sp. CCBAU 45384]|uniref:hypothetical protein n=1 Tax=Bradyrhizobium sp. CCBAU 45384 TaxID=858428 RepID=UPI00230625D2|nr:hypothetical protein [Bradyrhizobium sp. CCBAU 45384]